MTSKTTSADEGRNIGVHGHHAMRNIYPLHCQPLQHTFQVPVPTAYNLLPGIPTPSEKLLLPSYSYHYHQEHIFFNSKNGFIKLRAVHDFDPKKVSNEEETELGDMILRRLENKRERKIPRNINRKEMRSREKMKRRCKLLGKGLVYQREKTVLRKFLPELKKVKKEITLKVEVITLQDKVQNTKEETPGIQNQVQAIKTKELGEVTQKIKELITDEEDLQTMNESGESADSEEESPYAEMLTFKRGDTMETIPPANIGDKVRWWLGKHLDSGEIGFIPRNRVVIDEYHQPSKTTVNELPLELLDIILENSYLSRILHSASDQTDEGVIKALASVNFCWFQRITRLKKRIWRRLGEFYEKTKKSASIIRNNRPFLLANLQQNDKLIASLLSLNCITEEQSRFIQRKRSKRDKTIELLHVVRSFDKIQISNFVNCLRQTNQKTVARIVENGGDAIKVEVQDRGSTNTSSLVTKQIHQAIENLRQRTVSRSHQTDKLISQLKDDDMEILNSQLDKHTVVVWIWCHSQTAIENIQKLYESNQLTKILFGFANIRPPTSEIIHAKLINIESNELKKTCVVFQIFINFTGSLDVRIDQKLVRISGIAKLRNEVYILSASFGLIFCRIFEDRNPFRLQREFLIKEIKYPKDITSSENENCLYVSDYYNNCVWKIIREEDEQHKIVKWLTVNDNKSPSTMSVSSDGKLLMVSDYLNILDIYGSGAELVRSVQLPRNSKEIFHAVETSMGSLIILYFWKKKKLSRSSGREGEWNWGISEVTRDGQMVIRHFIPSNETEKLNCPTYLSLDSDDRLFVADFTSNRVILFNSDLKWNRILCQRKEETKFDEPRKLCYDEEKKQLIVLDDDVVKVYILDRK